MADPQVIWSDFDSQDVKTNKADWNGLHERVSLCVAVVAQELQLVKEEALPARLDDVHEFLR